METQLLTELTEGSLSIYNTPQLVARAMELVETRKYITDKKSAVIRVVMNVHKRYLEHSKVISLATLITPEIIGFIIETIIEVSKGKFDINKKETVISRILRSCCASKPVSPVNEFLI